MKWQEEAREYFRFNRKDRVAILLLSALILTLFLLPSFLPGPAHRLPDHQEVAWMDSLAVLSDTLSIKTRPSGSFGKSSGAASFAREPEPGITTYELFYFDPNTLTVSGWEKLGLRPRTIRTIQNYLSKGGRFRKAEDLQRVYGLREDEYRRLAPYVKLSVPSPAQRQYPSPPLVKERPDPRLEIIDINTADSLQWVALPGIGPKLASRIMLFRDKLGGFYTVDQVAETYGLPDTTFQLIRGRLKMGEGIYRKININTATLEELKAHPYIRWNLARPIIAYRNEHGPFKNAEGLLQVMAVTRDALQKMIPYLSYQ